MSERRSQFTADNRPPYTSELPENVTAGALALHGAAMRLRNKFRLMAGSVVNGVAADVLFKNRVLYVHDNSFEVRTDTVSGVVSMGLEELLVRRQHGLLKKQNTPEDVMKAHPFINEHELSDDQRRAVFHPAVDVSSIPGAYCNVVVSSRDGFENPFTCEYLKPSTGIIELQSADIGMTVSLNRDDCQVYAPLKVGELRILFDRSRVWALNILEGFPGGRFVNHQVALNRFGEQGVTAINADGSLKLPDCSRVLAPRFASKLFKASDVLVATCDLVEAAKVSLKVNFDEVLTAQRESPRFTARGKLMLVK